MTGMPWFWHLRQTAQTGRMDRKLPGSEMAEPLPGSAQKERNFFVMKVSDKSFKGEEMCLLERLPLHGFWMFKGYEDCGVTLSLN